MRRNIIAGIVLSCISAIILILYLSSFRQISKDVIIFLLTVVLAVSLFFVFFTDQQEGFFFEVSPERKKCLVEQVALVKNRSCSCCQKGTVGGYPPVYRDWLTPDGNNELWKRTDNYTDDPESNAYKTQLSPTELVS